MSKPCTTLPLRRSGAALGAAMMLSLCASTDVTSRNAADHARVAAAAEVQAPSAAPPFASVSGSFLLGSPRAVARRMAPALLQQVSLAAPPGQQSLPELVRLVALASGVKIVIDNLPTSASAAPVVAGAADSPQVALPGLAHESTRAAMIFNGPLHQVLDQITSGGEVWWAWRDGAVHVFHTETRAFDVPALNLATTVTSAITAQSGASGSSSGGATASIGSAANVDPWANVQAMAKAIAGKGAEVYADRNDAMLVVSATPPQIEAVSQWLDTLSERLRRQVGIEVHIYRVVRTSEDDYGIGLGMLFNSLSKNWGIKVVGAPTITPALGGSVASLGASVLSTATGAAGQFAGSSAVYSALSSLGQVSEVFNQSTIALDGQSTSMQQAQNIGYISGSTTTQTAAVGSSTAVTTSNLTPGFTLSLVPLVEGSRISLGMNMVLSSFSSLNPTTVGTTVVDLPQTASYSFQRSFSLRSGQSLMLTGFTQNTVNTANNGVGSPTFYGLGGGFDASRSHEMFVIVVSARILS